MRPLNEKLATDLLEAGKSVFLEMGFRDASLRGIAAKLGVTTGAIYRYYTDKEALFDAIVSGPAEELVECYRKAQQEYAERPLEEQLGGLTGISKENMWMMEFIYDHFDVFKLIVCNSAGTRYEHYIDILVEIEANSAMQLTEKMQEAGYELPPLNDELAHIISSGLFNCVFETVRHDMPRDKAFAYTGSYQLFYTAGWIKILGLKEGD